MQRANGDWFALSDNGGLRMPVFLGLSEAMVARSRDSGMECFRPVILDERGLENLRSTDGEGVCFWLVNDPTIELRRGRPIDFTQLTQFVRKNGRLAK